MIGAFKIGCLQVLVISLLVLPVFGQDLDDVTIRGSVSDQTGAVIVGATVKAISMTTGIERTVVTNANGKYRFIELAPDSYKIQASMSGFATKETKPFSAIAAQNLKLDLSLEIGTASATVSVSADDIPVIDTTRTIVGGTVTAEELEELPNTSNDVLDLVFTLAGTAEEPLSIRNLAGDDRIGGGSESDQPSEVLGAGNISLAGGAAYSTNITIDGLDNNDDRSAETRFQPPVGSVAEVQVITNQFSAEYGRASGGRINIRTKAGAKKFRGRFSMFFEDDSLNANTYNNNRRGLSRLPLTIYEPGIDLSGPIPFGYFKDRTFFFSSYDYRDRNASTQIFTALPLNQNPVFAIPAPTNPELSRPDLNEPGSELIASYILQVNTPQQRHRFTQRIDHNFTDRHNITFNYQRGRTEGFRQYRETTRFLEETLQGRTKDNDAFYITDNYVVNSNFVNQVRFQYSSLRPDFATKNPFDPVVLLNVNDETFEGNPDQIDGTVVIGNSTGNFASLRKEKRYQFQETANFVVGDFNLRFGTDIQRIDSQITELSDTTGTFNFENPNGFVANEIVRYRRNSNANSQLKNTYYSFFGQADWRFRENITLGFGLRYERETLVEDKNNFGPRAALAYSPGEDGKSVIRIGGGMFYNRALLRTLDDFVIDQNQQRFDSNRLSGTSDEPRCFSDQAFAATRDECIFLLAVTQGFPSTLTVDEIRAIPGINDIERGFRTDVFTRRLESNIKIPESYQFNVGYERDLGKRFAFEVNFTYNKAIRLWRERNINAVLLPAGFADFTEYLLSLGEIEIPGTSSGTDIYRFELGDTTDTNGDADSVSGSDCRSSTPICIVNLNTLNRSTSTLEPLGIAERVLEATIGRPITSDFDQLEEVGSRGSSVYEGLSFEIRRRFRQLGYGFGSSMRLSYVLSRTRDDGIVDTSDAQIQGDFDSEFSRSLTDRRHKFRFSGTTEMPNWFGKLRISTILRAESGRPFNVSIGGADRNLDDVSTDRPNYSGDLNDIVWHHPNDPFPQALFDSFSLAPIGSIGGNLPRNAGHGPPLFVLDMNFTRQFRIGERIKIRPQISFDNILNATVFSFGTNFINLATSGTPEFEQGFLTPSRTLRQRKIQIGVRVDF